MDEGLISRLVLARQLAGGRRRSAYDTAFSRCWRILSSWCGCAATPTLIDSAIEEIRRYDGPLQSSTERYTTTDVQIGEITIPRGSLVYGVLGSANRGGRSRYACCSSDLPEIELPSASLPLRWLRGLVLQDDHRCTDC